MKSLFNRKNWPMILMFGLLIFYLLANTGVFSDDFDAMARIKRLGLKDLFSIGSGNYYLTTPVMYFTHYVWYGFFKIDNSFLVSLIKSLYIFLSFLMVACFFTLYLDEATALFASFLFIFFPSHDSTVYWFMGQYPTLSFAFYLYAYFMAY